MRFTGVASPIDDLRLWASAGNKTRALKLSLGIILVFTSFMPAQAQGLEEQATTAYANAFEALAQAREAWAFARDKHENLAFLGDIVSEALGEERDLAGQMLVEVEALRVEADQFREIARTYQVRASDLVYSPAEAQEHAVYSQGRGVSA